jgi:hypothetical protein
MLFTITVDLPGSASFLFSTESIFEMVEVAQMLGNSDIVDEDDDYVDIPEELQHFFDDSDNYLYDEVKDRFCWFDEEHEAWYELDVEAGEWTLIENFEEEIEVEDLE